MMSFDDLDRDFDADDYAAATDEPCTRLTDLKKANAHAQSEGRANAAILRLKAALQEADARADAADARADAADARADAVAAAVAPKPLPKPAPPNYGDLSRHLQTSAACQVTGKKL